MVSKGNREGEFKLNSCSIAGNKCSESVEGDFRNVDDVSSNSVILLLATFIVRSFSFAEVFTLMGL